MPPRAFSDRLAWRFDHQRIDTGPSYHAFAHCTNRRVRDRSQTLRTQYQQIIMTTIGFCDHLPVIFSFQCTAGKFQSCSVTGTIDRVHIGIGDNGQSTRNKIIVHIALTFEFLFLTIFFGEPSFHLTKPHVVQFCGIDMRSRDTCPGQSGQRNAIPDALVGVIGGINCQ